MSKQLIVLDLGELEKELVSRGTRNDAFIKLIKELSTPIDIKFISPETKKLYQMVRDQIEAGLNKR